MRIFRSDTHVNHMPTHEFFNGALIASYETAERAHIIDSALDAAGFISEHTLTIAPKAVLERVHSPAYLEYLASIYPRWCEAGGAPEGVLPCTLAVRWMNRYSTHPLAEPGYYAFDLSAPIVAGTWAASLDAANMAYSAAQAIIDGAPMAYARCRPPGHHAGIDMCGGYCYINNAAVAAEALLVRGRVAILDIDIHHGNGTQQIFYGRNDVTFVSIHAHPDECYPCFSGFADELGESAGVGHNLNIPLSFGCDDTTYLQALDIALAFIATKQVDTLVISAGLDIFGGDPLGGFTVTRQCFHQIGQRCTQLGLPIVVVQEGGYAIEALGDNLGALLHGMMRV
jgi:acetoin utilization deacetylase AcuC-like enzyme